MSGEAGHRGLGVQAGGEAGGGPGPVQSAPLLPRKAPDNQEEEEEERAELNQSQEPDAAEGSAGGP